MMKERGKSLDRLNAALTYALLGGTLMAAFVGLACSDSGHSEGPGEHVADDGGAAAARRRQHELWPLENGYVSVMNEMPGAIPRLTVRMVFDASLVREAYAKWRQAPRVLDDDGGYLDKNARDGVQYAQASQLLEEVRRERVGRGAEWKPVYIEMILREMSCYFYRVERDGDTYVRQTVSGDVRTLLKRWFWLLIWGDDLGPRLGVGAWVGERGGYAYCGVHWNRPDPYRETMREPNRLGAATPNYTVRWNGRQYTVGTAPTGAFVLSPGLGVLAFGDFVQETPMEERHISGVTVRIIVPSRGLDLHNPEGDFELLGKARQAGARKGGTVGLLTNL